MDPSGSEPGKIEPVTSQNRIPGPCAIHPLKTRPRVSVNILTRDSESRLGRVLLEAASYADEVLVGVDAVSADGTFDIAASHADQVYRFSHSGRLADARMLVFRFASCDWILSLDDDESMEPAFDSILPNLLVEQRATHFWFPRKWIVNTDPCEYLHASPWFPDWQLRLFRNDATLVWKPPQPHSGYRVQGPGLFEGRAGILHFEPILCTGELRQKKLATYRETGGVPAAEIYYSTPPENVRRHAKPREAVAPASRPPLRRVHPGVEMPPPATPLWQSHILHVDLAPLAHPGEILPVTVLALNTGRLTWAPFYMGRSAQIRVGSHLYNEQGEMLQWDLSRLEVGTYTRPGEIATFLGSVEAPAAPGRYLLEWDLVSECECWFAELGSTTLRMPVVVAG
jgi:hypothetical protein